MVKMEFIFNLMGINLNKFDPNDRFIFLSYLLTRIHHDLFKKFKSHQQINMHTPQQDETMDDIMLENNFMMYLIKDILSTDEYSLSGIANHTRIPEDVIYDLFLGVNKHPSSYVWNKLIELHCTVRPHFYKELIIKIMSGYEKNQCCKKT